MREPMNNLYTADQQENFLEQFQKPGNLYRGTPFWAWNCKLDISLLKRQIDCFKEMGLGGFHIHSRTGLASEYLGKEFCRAVRECVDYAKEKKMLAWLYDEDRWPSGAAGGLVTKDVEFRARQLMFMPYTYEEHALKNPDSSHTTKEAQLQNVKLLARYSIHLDQNGNLADYRLLADGEEAADMWYLYRVINQTSSWFNNQTYIDTLNKKAIERFIEVTHEKYKETVGDEFNKTIPAIFTDEPQVTRKTVLPFAHSKQTICQPFTDDLPEKYKATYGEDFFETFPEIIWNLPDGKYSKARYQFHEYTAELFASSFADTIGTWCKKNNLRLTGHMMNEPSLGSQTCSLGEAMRSYRSFQLPGIDMLCDHREYTTAKQAQSASRQFGCVGVMSELYGVTNWDFDFEGHKNQGDWQAALGVTVRVQHLAWASMLGEAKRDYPASISYQSPWYKKYSYIEDHFARVNLAMTRGKPSVKVGVIHPIESFWLDFGPNDQSNNHKKEAEYYFSNLCSWLLFGLIDFDYISESLLKDQKAEIGDKFKVGCMEYETIIVPPMKTMRTSTFNRLKQFKEHGGKIVFAGKVAAMIDVEPNDSLQKLADTCDKIPFSQAAVMDSLADVRDIDIVSSQGIQIRSCLYQMREIDEANKLIFICNTEKERKNILHNHGYGQPVTVSVSGHWQIHMLDTQTGKTFPIEGRMENNRTSFDTCLYPTNHMLLKLQKSEKCTGIRLSERPYTMDEIEELAVARLNSIAHVVFDEPNALVLDRPAYSINGEQIKPPTEILKLDNIIRSKFNMPPTKGKVAQPWCMPEDNRIYGKVKLIYTFDSAIDLTQPRLAIEQPDNMEIFFNGQEVEKSINGFWVDESVKTITLPSISKGENTLEINVDYQFRTQLERCFILGNFGVKVRNTETTIIEQPETMPFGSITNHNMPFYTGNISYITEFNVTETSEYAILIPYYKGTMVEVICNKKIKGAVIEAPYKVSLGQLTPGQHKIELKLYGNRFNTFGSFHGAKPFIWNGGPDNWRSSGIFWTDTYNLKPLGIMQPPIVIRQQ